MSAMRTRFRLAVCVLLLAGSLSALPTCVLRGRVRDARTGEPLVGASVVIKGTERGNATDLNGDYVITGLPAMTGTATAAYVGYNDTSARFTTTAACTTHLNFSLQYPLVQLTTVWHPPGLIRLPPKSTPPPVRPRPIALPLPALRNANKHSDRFPIQAYGNGGLSIKWGYIDRTGKVVITPQFDTAGSFSDGFALVKTEGSYYYINDSGSPAFDGKYKDARSFSDSMASVSLNKGPGGGEWGAIDVKGRVVVRTMSAFPMEFHEGLASIWNYGDPQFAFVDRTGNMVIREGVLSQTRFSEGLARARIGGDNVFINRAGEVVLRPHPDGVADFREGLVRFIVDEPPAARWGYMDKAGKVVIKLQFENAGDFSEGLAPVMIGGKWGFINRAGKVVIAPEFAEARGFSEGLAVVSGIDNSPLYGYIDRRGATAIEPQFGRASDFSDGLAQVWIGDIPRGRYGRDDAERWLIERGGGPQSDLARIYRSGYIDRTGRYVW
jgi:hypothetical protein